MTRRRARIALVATYLFLGAYLSNASDESTKSFEEVVAEAESQLRADTRRDAQTPNFSISTDALSDVVITQVSGSLEGTCFTINQVLGLATKRPDRKVRVLLFESPMKQRGRRTPTTLSSYRSPGLIRYYMGDAATEDLLRLLVHSTTHAFFEQQLESHTRIHRSAGVPRGCRRW